MRDRLRLNNLHLRPRGVTAHADLDSGMRFPGASAGADSQSPSQPPFAPMHAWRPRLGADSIENAESALDHAERQMANLRALLGMEDQDPDSPRAA